MAVHGVMPQGLSTIRCEGVGRERPAMYPNDQWWVDDDEIPHKLGLVHANKTPWSCIGGAPSIIVAVAVLQSGGGWRQMWPGAALAELSWLVGHAARVCMGGMPPVVSVVGIMLVVVSSTRGLELC